MGYAEFTIGLLAQMLRQVYSLLVLLETMKHVRNGCSLHWYLGSCSLENSRLQMSTVTTRDLEGSDAIS
jgi:hypothetical protein